MTRRVIERRPYYGRTQLIYSCYLKGCKEPEHRHRMCQRHLDILKGKTK